MKVLKSWLKDYIEIKKSDEELSDLLSYSGTLVDDIYSKLDSKVVVAEIIEINPHPNADRLRLARVSDGQNEIELVCGATNIEIGQKVPLAKIGAKLSQDFEIKEAEIRGIKSSGMLCSEKELGLGQDHSGIKVLPEDYEVGKPLNQYLSSDTVFDLEITPNRGDCLSHLGIAREIAAITKESLKEPKINHIELSRNADISVTIEAKDKCFRYFAIQMKNVKVGPSPLWLQERLISLGEKPINNIVDITNYVMLDLGQPLHAFDAKKLKGKKIIIREAKSDEKIITLNGQTRKLDNDMLVIADEKDPIAIVGIMGGQNSEIDESTTEIVLESAEFERRSVRRTSKLLGITTEASYRFERGIDPKITEVAADKAAQMIKEIASGEILGKTAVIALDYENPWVHTKYDKINDLLGTNLNNTEIDDILKSLGFKLKDNQVQAPTWRHDVAIWQDLAEEVARIYGFSNIKKNAVPVSRSPHKSSYYAKEHLKDLLVANGFSEICNYSFLSEKDVKSLNIDDSDLLEVSNPIQIENKFLRKSLIPGLLRTIAKNPTFDPILVFESGHVFTKEEELSHLAFAVSGKQAKKIMTETIKKLSDETGIPETEFEIIELNRDELQRFKIKKPVVYSVEMDFEKLLTEKIKKADSTFELPAKSIHYRPVSKFPSVPRDIAFIVDKSISADEIINKMYEQSELINRVELFDEFESDKFGQGKKNIAFHLDLQDLKKTLTDKEAEEIIDKVIKSITSTYRATLRNY